MKYLTMADIHFKNRSEYSKKGDNGKVLVVGGSNDYVGCLVLAGVAALRTGVDVVTVAAPGKVAWAVNASCPDLISKKYNVPYFTLKEAAKIIKLAKGFDAMLIGNGLGRKSDPFARKVVEKSPIPVVVDADAIKAVGLKQCRNTIITPHKKEFEIFLKNSRAKKEKVQDKIDDNVILLKGKIDRIISKDGAKYNNTGNQGMSKAGTGDVLAGLAVGFLAQGYTKVEAASYAAYINGTVADILKAKKGYAYIASDIVEDLNKWFKARR